MAADGKSEVRFDIPLRDLAVLDAYCHATGKGRTAVMLALLQEWTEAKRYEAMMVCRVAGVNPMASESDRSPTPMPLRSGSDHAAGGRQ